MKLEPRKAADRGGWLCMPLVMNRQEGKPGWKKGALYGMWNALLAETGGCRSC